MFLLLAFEIIAKIFPIFPNNALPSHCAENAGHSESGM